MAVPSRDEAPRRVWLYARRSDASGDERRSVEEQVVKGRADTARAGDVVDREWRELGSGTSGRSRPVFSEMIDLAISLPPAARPHRIWFLDSSRFSRMEVPEAFSYIHRLKEAGVAIDLGIDQAKVTGEAAYIMLTVLLTGNRAYAVTTGFKVALGHAAALAAGRWHGGRVPYGYVQAPHASGRGKTFAVNEAQAQVVRRIYRDYLAGLAPLSIAAGLTRDRVPSPGGGKWIGRTVKGILTSRAYVGDSALNDHRPGRSVSIPMFYRASEAGPLTPDAPAKALVKEDAHPAIVAREDWDRVQARCAARRIVPSGGRPALLTGLSRCGACGAAMKSQGQGKTTHRYRYYACSSRQKYGAWSTDSCSRATVRESRLEPAILAAVREQVAKLDPERLAAEVRAALPDAPRVDVAAIEAKRRALARRRDELALDVTLDGAFVRAALARLADEDARLAGEVERACAAEGRAVDVDALAAAAVEAARRLDAPDTPEGRAALREVLRVFVKKIEVMPSPRLRWRALKPVSLTVYEPKALAFTATGTKH